MKLSIRSALVLTLAILVTATGALAQRAPRKSRPSSTATAAKDYFPLRVGYLWKYTMVEEPAEFTVNVLGEEKQPDGTSLYMIEQLAGNKIHKWYSKSGGWVLLTREAYPDPQTIDVTHNPAKQVLKEPLVAGDRWTWKGTSETQNPIVEQNTVVGPETVKVPAGTFRAVKIVSLVSEGAQVATKTYWYAPGVGLVKRMTEAGRNIKYTWELTDYSFKETSRKASR